MKLRNCPPANGARAVSAARAGNKILVSPDNFCYIFREVIVALPQDDSADRRRLTIRKLYYSIGEVSQITGVPAHVLRYWENEFPQLKPKKGRSGNRTYQEREIELIKKIKELLYDHKFTIPGARAQLAGVEIETSNGNDSMVEELKQELREILEMLNHSGRGAAR
jgi:DNA-binding transcriptional MerR regulator